MKNMCIILLKYGNVDQTLVSLLISREWIWTIQQMKRCVMCGYRIMIVNNKN